MGDILLKKGRQIVDKIPSAECTKIYVGQTSGAVRKRTEEHMRWCQKKYKRHILKSTKKNDGVAYRHHSAGHKIDFENVVIITQENSYWRRLIREGLEIKQLGKENRANDQAGYEINECWDSILGENKM